MNSIGLSADTRFRLLPSQQRFAVQMRFASAPQLVAPSSFRWRIANPIKILQQKSRRINDGWSGIERTTTPKKSLIEISSPPPPLIPFLHFRKYFTPPA